ncbi:hypothetical protein C0J52_28063 [Blattella germanica]|nr:hypothetical protein C0J52_28063 [Blattella germanica]
MDSKLEQRANICVKLQKSATETYEMLKEAYWNKAMSRTRCFELHSRFKNGRTSLEIDEMAELMKSATKSMIIFLRHSRNCAP